jgi:hypothetical protein
LVIAINPTIATTPEPASPMMAPTTVPSMARHATPHSLDGPVAFVVRMYGVNPLSEAAMLVSSEVMSHGDGPQRLYGAWCVEDITDADLRDLIPLIRTRNGDDRPEQAISAAAWATIVPRGWPAGSADEPVYSRLPAYAVPRSTRTTLLRDGLDNDSRCRRAFPRPMRKVRRDGECLSDDCRIQRSPRCLPHPAARI